MARAAAAFPDEVLEHVFSFVGEDAHRNAISLVCKGWHRIDRRSRRRACVGNCYAVAPEEAVRRFPEVRAVWIKGKPHFADFTLVPADWGGGAGPWVAAMAEGWPQLEELHMKGMVVSDACLDLVSRSFKNFKVLSLASCEGFGTAGLASVAANCRYLRELNLQESVVEENCRDWLSHFPESFNSLESVNIACLEAEVCFPVLERLVSRCTKLRTLELNHEISLDQLATLLLRAPQLVDLGTGRFLLDFRTDLYSKLELAFAGLKNLKSLSGIWQVSPLYLPTIYSVCSGLTSLKLIYAVIQNPELLRFASQCKNLQKLWVMDLIGDAGLNAVAESCKFLEELRVFPSGLLVTLTERGLVAVSVGCPMLNSVLYFCHRMTNSALLVVAKNSPNLIRFGLCIIEPKTPDYVTKKPLDAGFGAIVKFCKDLRRLYLSGLLTDHVFKLIGAFAGRLEMLSVAFAGDTDLGLHYILSGCKSLRKLEIRDCPFGDKPLLDNAEKLETMRSLWMSSCSVSLGACRLLARKIPRLNVEVIDERGQLDSRSDEFLVEKLYVYRSLAGPRSDAPHCVWTL